MCNPPEITLIPGTLSSFSRPLQYRRSQDFYILSIIKLNCNKSILTNKKWIINNCTTTNCSNEVLSNKIINPSLSELYIPSNTLPYGVYQFVLIVTMIDYPSLTSSSLPVYIQITPSGITANLVELGTTLVTSGYQQNLQLNPGNYSVDPDGFTFNASVS